MLESNNTALIVIDVQPKLFDVMYEKDELFRNIQLLIKAIRILELPIIATNNTRRTGLNPARALFAIPRRHARPQTLVQLLGERTLQPADRANGKKTDPAGRHRNPCMRLSDGHGTAGIGFRGSGRCGRCQFAHSEKPGDRVAEDARRRSSEHQRRNRTLRTASFRSGSKIQGTFPDHQIETVE